LTANSKEISRQSNLNNKILECLGRIEQQNQKSPVSRSDVDQQSPSRVTLYHLFNFRSSLLYIFLFLESNLLVGIAGESLGSSVPESVSGRCEQCALCLQKFTPNRQLARESLLNIQ
jgi:hypothetical protein